MRLKMKKIINISNFICFPKENDDWCRYACMQMLLGFKGISCFDQKKFFEIHRNGIENYEKNTSYFINNLNLIVQGIIEYWQDPDLTENDIKKFILNDNPVCVILFPDKKNDYGNSYILYGFDDSASLFYVIDPDNASKKEMSYSDFDLYFNENRQSHLIKEIFIVR
jgi:hypothetical protein